MTNVITEAWDGDHELLIDKNGFGVIDDEARAAFTRGQCHALALALHELTGWLIVGLGDVEDSPAHCVVYCPELDEYVDIKGHYENHHTYEVSNHDVRPHEITSGYLRDYFKPDLDAARPFARTILRDISKLFPAKKLQAVRT